MTSKASKTFFPRLRGKWIWVLTSIIILGAIYFVYRTSDTAPKIEYVNESEVEQFFEEKPSETITPLHDFFSMIQKTGADFDSNYIVDYRKYSMDSIPPNRDAVYLGVNAADIAYLSTYGKTQLAANYVDVCLQINEMRGNQNANNFETRMRFEKSPSNTDSITQFLYQFDSIISRCLKENTCREQGVMMLAGAFIESLYIATQIFASYPKGLLPDDMSKQVLSPLNSIILNQQRFLRSLIEELENLDGKGEWELATINSLKELYQIYTNYPSSKFYPPPKESPSFKKLLLLSEYVETLRAAIIY